jgi:hypothetical protein
MNIPPRHGYLGWALLWVLLPCLPIVILCALLFSDVYALAGFLQLLAFVTILVSGCLDIVALLQSVSAFTREFASGRLDLLRLTLLHEWSLVWAKHALALMRTRRFTLLVVGVRLSLLIGVMLYSVAQLPPGVRSTTAMLIQAFFVSLIFLIYLIEPFWRAEAMTALGIYLSAQNRSTSSTLLLAGFSLGAVWLGSLMVVGVASAGLALMASLLLSTLGYISFEGAMFLGLWFNLFFLVLLGSAIYGFYHLLERWCLRGAQRALKSAE